jgi:hypothetical protein
MCSQILITALYSIAPVQDPCQNRIVKSQIANRKSQIANGKRLRDQSGSLPNLPIVRHERSFPGGRPTRRCVSRGRYCVPAVTYIATSRRLVFPRA